MSRTALILSVGESADPLFKAMERAKDDGEIALFPVYGRPFPGRPISPLDIVNELKEKAQEFEFELVNPVQAHDPLDLQSCIQAAEIALKSALEWGAEKIVFNFTGGTKPLASGLLYVAISRTTGLEVSLEYTREKPFEVISLPTVSEERMREALRLASSFSYSQAAAFLKAPDLRGRPAFLHRALNALSFWDGFLYKEAYEEMRRLRPKAELLIEDRLLGKLSLTILRLSDVAGRMANLVKWLAGGNLNQASKDPKGLSLLPADALENSFRRLKEGRFADAALGAYRAVECAAQVLLLSKYGFWPGKPNWELLPEGTKEKLMSFLGYSRLPFNLGLRDSLILLHNLSLIGPEWSGKFESFCSIRNQSLLEHGYSEVSREGAERALKLGEELTSSIIKHLGGNLDELRSSLRHKV